MSTNKLCINKFGLLMHRFLSCATHRVGGIPEVLPERFLYFVQPDAASIEAGLAEAIEDVADGRRPAKRECHEVGAGAILDNVNRNSDEARAILEIWRETNTS